MKTPPNFHLKRKRNIQTNEMIPQQTVNVSRSKNNDIMVTRLKMPNPRKQIPFQPIISITLITITKLTKAQANPNIIFVV